MNLEEQIKRTRNLHAQLKEKFGEIERATKPAIALDPGGFGARTRRREALIESARHLQRDYWIAVSALTARWLESVGLPATGTYSVSDVVRSYPELFRTFS